MEHNNYTIPFVNTGKLFWWLGCNLQRQHKYRYENDLTATVWHKQRPLIPERLETNRMHRDVPIVPKLSSFKWWWCTFNETYPNATRDFKPKAVHEEVISGCKYERCDIIMTPACSRHAAHKNWLKKIIHVMNTYRQEIPKHSPFSYHNRIVQSFHEITQIN